MGTPIDDWSQIGWAIRVERQARRMRQEDLAALARVERTWLTRLENGQARVDADSTLRVLDALGFDLVVQRRESS